MLPMSSDAVAGVQRRRNYRTKFSQAGVHVPAFRRLSGFNENHSQARSFTV